MKGTKPRISSILGWVFLSVCLLIFAIAVIFVIDARQNNRPVSVFGFQFYFVVTGSMEPTIKTNGMAITKQQNYDDIEVGDIIAFRSTTMNGQVAIHRVVEKTDKGARTQGDNNGSPDIGYVTSENYQGTVVFRTNLTAGYITNLQRPGGILRMVILPLVILVLIVVAYKFLTAGTDWRFRGLIISIIVLLVSGSAFLSIMLR